MLILVLICAGSWFSEPTAGTARPPVGGESGLAQLARPMALARQALFDSYQHVFVRERSTQPVTIVEIDEKSLLAVGQWPWPRNRLADLINAIAQQGPVAIGLDIYMPEADQTSPERVASNLPAEHHELSRLLAALPTHDDQLAQALSKAPTVLGAVGLTRLAVGASVGLRTRPVATHGVDPIPWLHDFPWVIASLPIGWRRSGTPWG